MSVLPDRPDRPNADPEATVRAKAPPPPLTARAPAPVAIRLRRSVVLGLALAAALLLAGSLAWAFVVKPELRERVRRQPVRETADVSGTVRPSELVTVQPATYDRLADSLPAPRRLGGSARDVRTPAADHPPAAPPAAAGPHARPTGRSTLTAQARESALFFPARGTPAAPAAGGPAPPDNPGPDRRPSADYAAMYAGHPLLPALSPYEVKAGAIVPAALLTAVDTARAGPVVASVTQNVFDTVSGRHLLVPQGARLIGRAGGENRHGERRAYLTWDRLLLPNGKSVLLGQEPAVDAQGATGVPGRVDRRLGPLALATLFAGAITTLGQIARDDDHESDGLLGDAGDAAALEAAQVGGKLIDRELEVRPSIRLATGAPVRVLITRDLILEPYQP